jgi:hypothetical protein
MRVLGVLWLSTSNSCLSKEAPSAHATVSISKLVAVPYLRVLILTLRIGFSNSSLSIKKKRKIRMINKKSNNRNVETFVNF